MGAATYKIIAEQGATYAKVFTLRDSAGALINLTGYTARLQVRENYAAAAALLDLTTENGGIALGGAGGTVSLLITAAQLAAIVAPDEPGTPPALVCVYDLELCYGASVTRLLQGKFLVMREVTR
jgi:hypothetical protein